MSRPQVKKRPPDTPERRSPARWWVGAVLAVAVVGAAVAWFVYEAAQTRRQETARALQLAGQGRLGEAMPMLEAAYRVDPDNVDVTAALARGLLGAERLDDARPVLDHWCTLRPNDVEPLRLRLYVLHRTASQSGMPTAERQHLMELALADGQKVLELAPDDYESAHETIWLALAVGRFDDAEQLCKLALQRYPGNPRLLFLQARVCQAQGQTAEAQRLLDTVLAALPQFAPARLLRATLYYEAGEPEKAIPLLRELVAREPSQKRAASYYLGLALARTGQADEARRVMLDVDRSNLERTAAQVGTGESPAVRVRRAELLLGSGQADEARAILDGVLKEDPDYAAAHAVLAAYYESQGDKAKAAEERARGER